MYFILKNDILLDLPAVDLNESENTSSVCYANGKKITENVNNPIVINTTATIGEQMVDFRDGSILIMSKRFLELFKAAGVDNLQIFPVIIKSTTDGTVWEDYFAVNILTMISCADLSKSDYSEIIAGVFFSFHELAIDVEKTQGALLFRLQEDPTTIIMHRSVGRYVRQQDPDKTLLGWTIGTIIQDSME